MQAEVAKTSPTEVEVRIEIPWDRVEKGLNDSFKAMAQHTRVKGFRPGKVPQKVLRRMYGRQVRGEVTAELMQQSLIEAVTEHELPVVSAPEVETPEFHDGKPLSFVAKLQVRPEITPVDLDSIEVTRVVEEIGNEAVDAAVEEVRRQHAELRNVEDDRGAEKGDVLTVDYQVELDGEEKPEMAAEGRTLELGNDSLDESFEAGLLGAKVGEERDVDLPFDEDDQREELAGKTARFHIVVKSIQQRILPEVDDEFAKDVGDYASLLELRLDIRKRLEAGAKQRVEEQERENLIEALLEAHEVPVPPAMVEEEKREMLATLGNIARGSGLGAEMLQQLLADLDGRAERKVRVGLLLGALAKHAQVEVTEADMNQRLEALAEESGKHLAKVKADHHGERGERLKHSLLEEKLFGHLRSAVKWKDPKPEDAAGEETSDPQPPQE